MSLAPISTRKHFRRPRTWVACFFLAAPAFAGHAPPPPRPYAVIPVDAIGFRPPGPLYLLARLSSLSLDFIDDTHLLFTFHRSRLLSREDSDIGHDDQLIRAVVLEAPSGKVDAEAEWRLHDRRPYLFPLGDGQFLLRQGSDLFRFDRNLAPRPFLHFKHRIESAEISSDGRLLTIQSDHERHSAERHRRLVEQAIANGEDLPEEDVEIQMVKLDTREVVADARADAPLRLAVSSTGYVDHDQSSAGRWTVYLHRFASEGGAKTGAKPSALSEVSSSCTPSEDFLGTAALLVHVCKATSENHLAVALATAGKDAGKELWKGEWDTRLVWPTLRTSAEGRAFAISWIVANHPVNQFYALVDDDVQGQTVQVLSTATGHLLLAVDVLPVISGGHNYALSEDGTKLAVLNRGTIELYDVPPDVVK